MPTDSQGRFHLNTQKAMASDRAMTKSKAPKSMEAKGREDENKGIPEHSDVASHLSNIHSAEGGKHILIHKDDMGNIRAHHVGADGSVDGPHDHANLDDLKSSMDQFLDEESKEKDSDSDSEEKHAEPEHKNHEYRMMSGL